MTTEVRGEVRKVWRWEDQCGAEAPPDVDKRDLVKAWLWDVEGIDIEACTDAEVADLADRARFCRLYSVVKADLDNSWCDTEVGGFHSEGSGKRTKDAWFIDVDSIYDVADAVISRRDVSRADDPAKPVGIGPHSSTSPEAP